MAVASSSEHIYPLSGGLDTVWLYASPSDSGWTSIEQGLLPGFGDVYHAQWKGSPMKGVWGGDKNVSKEHRPALDALATVDAELLRQFIASVVSTGAAVSISITRDAGAVVLTVLDGNQRHKLYPSDQYELRQALVDGIESFSPDQTPPNTKAPKSR